jgi:transposase
MPNFLTSEQVQVLKQSHKGTREKRLADRIKAVLMLNFGFTHDQISQALLLDETTIRRHVEKFQTEGIEGLLECHFTGGQSRLTSIQETELKTFLKENTKRTAMEIVSHIQKTYGVKFTVIGATKLLHRLGFSYKKPKIIPGKADQQKQIEFLTKYEEIKANLKEKDEIYFLDSTHPQHNTKPSYGWILKGKNNDKFVKTNSGRKRINLSGALNLKNHTAIVLEEETINYRVTLKLLKKLKNKQPTGKVYLILDNASYYHKKEVKAWVKKHRRFKLIFLPSYSPNLNLIERLWRFFHQKITWNHYFETYEEFRKISLKFFRNLEKYKNELSTLLTDNFQVVPNLNLQS